MPRFLPALWTAVERFAHARGALMATFLWNFGQASVVPGPAELLLVPLAVADPPRRWQLVTVASIGSVLGGCVTYWIGSAAYESVGRPMLAFFGVGDAAVSRVTALMLRYGWAFIVVSTLTPISTKAVSIGAGSLGLPFPLFVSALAVGRSLRFTLDVLVLRASADALQRLRTRVFRT
ncbi:MAG TPA: VTT domain-containing protein [Gemmatimonadaceae bacterium]|nr:VTT domain-containing protein [Gemmatimonadaceae bacterium]